MTEKGTVVTFYMAPGASGDTSHEEKMLRAHDAEAAKYGAEFYNYGKVIGADLIYSKTDRGTLETRIDPETMKVTHDWEAYDD